MSAAHVITRGFGISGGITSNNIITMGYSIGAFVEPLRRLLLDGTIRNRLLLSGTVRLKMEF